MALLNKFLWNSSMGLNVGKIEMVLGDVKNQQSDWNFCKLYFKVEIGKWDWKIFGKIDVV